MCNDLNPRLLDCFSGPRESSSTVVAVGKEHQTRTRPCHPRRYYDAAGKNGDPGHHEGKKHHPDSRHGGQFDYSNITFVDASFGERRCCGAG